MNWYIFSAILFIFLLITFTFAYIIFHQVSVRRKPRNTDIRSIFSQNKIDIVGEENIKSTLSWIEESISERVCIKSEDGLKIHCSLINADGDVEEVTCDSEPAVAYTAQSP